MAQAGQDRQAGVGGAGGGAGGDLDHFEDRFVRVGAEDEGPRGADSVFLPGAGPEVFRVFVGEFALPGRDGDM